MTSSRMRNANNPEVSKYSRYVFRTVPAVHKTTVLLHKVEEVLSAAAPDWNSLCIVLDKQRLTLYERFLCEVVITSLLAMIDSEWFGEVVDPGMALKRREVVDRVMAAHGNVREKTETFFHQLHQHARTHWAVPREAVQKTADVSNLSTPCRPSSPCQHRGGARRASRRWAQVRGHRRVGRACDAHIPSSLGHLDAQGREASAERQVAPRSLLDRSGRRQIPFARRGHGLPRKCGIEIHHTQKKALCERTRTGNARDGGL